MDDVASSRGEANDKAEDFVDVGQSEGGLKESGPKGASRDTAFASLRPGTPINCTCARSTGGRAREALKEDGRCQETSQVRKNFLFRAWATLV